MTFAEMTAAGIRLHAIAAMASNRVIGTKGSLPWHLPEDLRLFKERTLGHPIIMGRSTFESFPKQRPLPRRRNVVISRTLAPREGIDVIRRLDELPGLGITGDAYLIGGARVFAAYLDVCASLILTYIYKAHEGDTFMPAFEDTFVFEKTLATFPDFEVHLYRRNSASNLQ